MCSYHRCNIDHSVTTTQMRMNIAQKNMCVKFEASVTNTLSAIGINIGK